MPTIITILRASNKINILPRPNAASGREAPAGLSRYFILIAALNCLLIGQLAAEQPQAATPVAPSSATAGDEEHPAVETVSPPAQTFNTTVDQSPTTDIPESSDSHKSALSAADNTVMQERSALLRKRPPGMVAEAMALPSGSTVTGQALTLGQALSASADRPHAVG